MGDSSATASLLDAFLGGLAELRTRANYGVTLHRWTCWLDERSVEVTDVTRAVVEAYIRRLERDGYAPSRICQRLSALSSSYRWGVNEAHVATNPVAAARRPRRPVDSTTQAMSRHELTDWRRIAAAGAYAAACRPAMNGLRVGELCAADVGDLGEQTWHRILRLRAETTTKGHKPAVIALWPRHRAGDRPGCGRTRRRTVAA